MDNLLAKMRHYYQDAYFDTLERAYEIAKQKHAGQKRMSGEEYFVHPYNVAEILVDLGLDTATVAAALLHAVVEDTDFTREDMLREFGEEIASLVDGVTKLDRITFASKEEEQAENLRKMFFAMAKDVRVILIKLADRLDNMRTLSYLPLPRQTAMARETLDIYAPLAGRLGISSIKCELEDLCLKYLDPEFYNYLAEQINLKRAERNEMVERIIRDLEDMLREMGIKGEVFGRPKHFYSIYKKMMKQHKSLDEIYDLIAVRIVVDSVKDCYNVLGTIHTKWRPIPGRIKDYIATPKQNMYQSLHTTVITNYGQTFEIQIRTAEMHKIAEFGIAAHWKYKEGRASVSLLDEKLSWLRELMEYEGEFQDSKHFYNNLKIDLDLGEVLVFTPKGDVISLPSGSTPIDFAYHIHSQIGNKCVGAKVNSKMVPLDYQLQVGDVVEVITNQNAKGPSWDWLKLVKSSGAKAKIRQFFKKQMKEENIRKGREMLELEAKRRGFKLADLLTQKGLNVVYDRFSFEDLDEVCSAVGYGAVTTNQIIFRLIESYTEETRRPDQPIIVSKSKTSSHGVLINGYEGMLVRYAGCCNPVPGDEIVGFVSRGRGVSIHRTDCPNLKNAEPERLIPAAWDSQPVSAYTVTMQITASDKPGIIADITQILTKMNLNITAFNARLDKRGNAVISVSVQVKRREEFEMIQKKLLENPFINDVFRTTN